VTSLDFESAGSLDAVRAAYRGHQDLTLIILRDRRGRDAILGAWVPQIPTAKTMSMVRRARCAQPIIAHAPSSHAADHSNQIPTGILHPARWCGDDRFAQAVQNARLATGDARPTRCRLCRDVSDAFLAAGERWADPKTIRTVARGGHLVEGRLGRIS
jgi:hypothetical protein